MRRKAHNKNLDENPQTKFSAMFFGPQESRMPLAVKVMWFCVAGVSLKSQFDMNRP